MIQSQLVTTSPSQKLRFKTARPFVRVARRFRQWWMARRTCQIVAELTHEQLADAGIDLSAVTGPISIQAVERGYHAHAAGWR